MPGRGSLRARLVRPDGEDQINLEGAMGSSEETAEEQARAERASGLGSAREPLSGGERGGGGRGGGCLQHGGEGGGRGGGGTEIKK